MHLRYRLLAIVILTAVTIFFFHKYNNELPRKALTPVISYSQDLSSASSNHVKDLYFHRLTDVHKKCDFVRLIGDEREGGWHVCMARSFRPKKPCLVYSFGVNHEWGFDEAMAKDYGCTVRAFDPSMATEDHVHTPGPVNFYKTGLGGLDRTLSNGWQVFTLQSLLARFGEADRTLDLVKIDIEYSEWKSFESMLATGVLKRTKQLIFETHTRDVTGATPSNDDYLFYHKILDGIEALGFRRFLRHHNQLGIFVLASNRLTLPRDSIFKNNATLYRTCCHKLYYVNMYFDEE